MGLPKTSANPAMLQNYSLDLSKDVGPKLEPSAIQLAEGPAVQRGSSVSLEDFRGLLVGLWWLAKAV